ncbi:MAG: sulfotransferase family 2 domain-containing protein [Halioglobus sp.]
MPYSDSLGLVYVAIPKTGTTSITHALHRICPPENPLRLVKEDIDAQFRDKYNLNEIGDSKPGKAKHLSAIQIKYILGETEFARCTKFSVVRNPWARMVSRYFFTHVESEPSQSEKLRRGTTRRFHDKDFDIWIKNIWKRHKLGRRKNSQLAKLVDLDGRLLVDHVGQLEDVQSTLDWVAEQLGIEPIKMPHLNGTRKGHYAQFYNTSTKDMVAEICRQDIEYFNYRFEE